MKIKNDWIDVTYTLNWQITIPLVHEQEDVLEMESFSRKLLEVDTDRFVHSPISHPMLCATAPQAAA